MKGTLRILLLAGLWLLPSCFYVEHYVDDASRMDGLYFGPEESIRDPEWMDESWRIYALFGLVAWSDRDIRFAGTELAGLSPEQRPATFYISSGISFLNGLAATGLGLVTGVFQPLLFVPFTTTVQGRARSRSL